ncbi:unnamed protein product [Allacma fusca]|uniref:Uncharacterized protein n=1 Tax=Allacma fusca TaxID=39272 RepID=A0A8J2KHU7_9HEXA|nr:unnamed protein product [Allacma fusca]
MISFRGSFISDQLPVSLTGLNRRKVHLQNSIHCIVHYCQESLKTSSDEATTSDVKIFKSKFIMNKPYIAMAAVAFVATSPPGIFCLFIGDPCVYEIKNGLSNEECTKLVKYLKNETQSYVSMDPPDHVPYEQSCAWSLKKVTRNDVFAYQAQGLLRSWLESNNRTDLNRCLNDHYPDFVHIDEDYDQEEQEGGNEVKRTQPDNEFIEFVVIVGAVTVSVLVIGVQIYSSMKEYNCSLPREYLLLDDNNSQLCGTYRKKLGGSDSPRCHFASEGDEVEEPSGRNIYSKEHKVK